MSDRGSMDTKTLQCPNCGASATTETSKCEFCQTRLAMVACPSCFGMLFVGNKFCPNCGARAERNETGNFAKRICPRCDVPLRLVTVGANTLDECAQCDGLWVDVAAFDEICINRDQQAVVLGGASPPPREGSARDVASTIKYIPCPVCGKLMNRIQFAHCSRVIIDVCKGHGSWFDANELRQIVEFIRAGGIEKSRQKQLEQLALERERLRMNQTIGPGRILDKLAETDREIGLAATAMEFLRYHR